MHSRRPLPALALVLPHPPLPNRSSIPHFGAISPHTPRACTPSTPVLFPTQLVASPRTSTDSWNSSSGNGDDEVQWEWKPEQMSLLVRTLDALPGHLFTPFNGPVPPSNLLDKLARSVSQAQGALEWPHSLRATRAKLAEIARARDKGRSKENMSIDERDEDEVMGATSRQSANKRPLYRQSSMDFLPSKDKGSGNLSRLSSRLQRTDRMIPTYHPYARPTSRSPSPPIRAPHSEARQQDYFPPVFEFAPAIPQRTPRPRTSSNSLGSRIPPTLQRSASTISTHSNPIPTSALAASTNTGILPPVKLRSRTGVMRRSDSFSYAAPVGSTLKRAPSFGASSIASGVSSHVAIVAIEGKQTQEPESDEEEKAREKKAKRPRTRSTALPGSPEKKRHDRDKKVKVQKDLGVGKPLSTASSPIKPKSRPKPVRGASMFGAELPQPQPQTTLPTASPKTLSPSAAAPRRASVSPPPAASDSPPKTLRRIKTTTFNLGPCPPARRISFGSLTPPSEEQEHKRESGAKASVLGSAFQLS